MLPKISIITPSYNQGQFLEKTILSILNQGYPNLEYIIIDGGSTDNSVDIIRKYEKRIDYWVSEQDGGQSNAINKGFHIAKGEIINWINSDDLLLPGAIKKIVEAFQSNQEFDFIYGNHIFIDKDGKLITLVKNINFDFKIMLYSGNYICQPAAFFKKSLLDRHGYLDESFQVIMDSELYTRFSAKGCLFKHISIPIAALRWHCSAKTLSRMSEINKARDLIRYRYGKFSLQARGLTNGFITTLLVAVFRCLRYIKAVITARSLVFPMWLRIHLFNRGVKWYSRRVNRIFNSEKSSQS